MIKGDYDNARQALVGKEGSPKFQWYSDYLDGVQNEAVKMFLLQEHVSPARLIINDQGQEINAKTLLRIYFVPNDLDAEVDINVYFEILAGSGDRVSLAGYGIPLILRN